MNNVLLQGLFAFLQIKFYIETSFYFIPIFVYCRSFHTNLYTLIYMVHFNLSQLSNKKYFFNILHMLIISELTCAYTIRVNYDPVL